MKVGIGLPTSIPGARPDLVLEWARAADAGPLSSVAVIDRVVYPSYEPLVALASVAGVTQRVGLMTSILQAPLRNATLLAKQAASLDALSHGRLTLGMAVGGRVDDFRAVSACFEDRGRRFDKQLALMKQIWSGRPLGDGVGAIGPTPTRPGGPEVLIGGYLPAAIRRVGRWADGYLHEGPPTEAAELYREAEKSWKAAGREGRPRFVGAFYFGLGPNAREKASASSATTMHSRSSRCPEKRAPPSGIWQLCGRRRSRRSFKRHRRRRKRCERCYRVAWMSAWTKSSPCPGSPNWTRWTAWPRW